MDDLAPQCADDQISSPEFTHIRISAVPSYKEAEADSVEAAASSELSIRASKKSSDKFLAHLHVKFNLDGNKSFPYVIEVACICHLVLKPISPTSEHHKKVAQIAHNVLFPAVRELVLNLTARQPWGAFSLGMSALEQAALEEKNSDNVLSEKKPKMRRKPSTPKA